MAKVTYTKLALKANSEVATFEQNGQTIEVKQYLPIEEKMNMIANIINNSQTDNGYYNIGMIEMHMALEIIFNYTNVTFTEKQKENLTKLYDVVYSSEFYDDVMQCVPKSEVNWIRNTTYHMMDKIYEYKNSVYGILDGISQDYSNLDLDATTIQQKIANGENVSFLKEVLTKLG